MKSKNKNKVPKLAKTRLSDLTPKKDARAGKYRGAGPGPAPTPPFVTPPVAPVATSKKQYTL